jgi:carbamoyl-phosphate synthase large subunit
MIDIWFLDKISSLIEMENRLKSEGLGKNEEHDYELLSLAKDMGYTDTVIARHTGMTRKSVKELRNSLGIEPAFRMVDTCAAEFAASTPYYYSCYNSTNELNAESTKKKVLVLGSGPIRIGQGIEFDYCSVHSVWALKKYGYEAIIINNNPETVSTDFDIADKLYFEPLTYEDVENIVEFEQPYGAVVQFGGQTAIKLAGALKEMGVKILGTSVENVNNAEDRECFDEILEKCGIPRPKGKTVFALEEAIFAANSLGYPVLVRPSYVLGGQGMEIAYSDEDIIEYMTIINRTVQEHPVLVDKYVIGKEVEVDAICDGESVLIPGIMEHQERAGVHSGDSISIYPPQTLSQKVKDTIVEYTRKMALELNVIGLINIQYIVSDEKVYVIEANPRSSRTVPYISKVTGIPMVELATRCLLGEKLKNMEYGTGLHPDSEYIAIKMPVFSFEKLNGADISLGPEMKSTGEVLGISKDFSEALLKAFIGANIKIVPSGRVAITVSERDKAEIINIARGFKNAGFLIYATEGTCKVLAENGIEATPVLKLSEGKPNILDLIHSGSLDLVIDTPTHGRQSSRDGFRIRRGAVERGIPCLTSMDTASAMLSSLKYISEHSGGTQSQYEAGKKLSIIDISKI